MSRIIKSAARVTNQIFFPKPLKQGQFKIVPPPSVPSNIQKPPYMLTKNPIFGLYEGAAVLHNQQAIKKMKKSAKIASNTLAATQHFIKSSYEKKQQITEQDIDRFVFDKIVQQNAYPTPIGFMHFPKSVCVSVNQCIVHGIPTTRPVEEGDKINIDVTVYYDGYHGDNNLTVTYGPPKNQQIGRMIKLAQQGLYQAIQICKPGVPFSKIGYTLEKFAQKHGIHICEMFSGHGIGQLLHMPPMVLHKYYPQLNEIMKPGNIFTIQPIFTLYPTNKIQVWQDQFTTISENNPNAQFEHTILITQTGFQVLTIRQGEQIPKLINN